MKNFCNKVIAAISVAVMIAVIAGCGNSAETVTVTETRSETITGTLYAPQTRSVGEGTVGDTGPIMPNVDETQVETVTQAAITAFEREWGDGSGVNVVWGPNIISGWALAGLENNSGVSGKDVLLAQENGAWIVKDMGHVLSVKWESQTPSQLWPSM